MTCKYCGENELKDASTDELKGEIERRKGLEGNARAEYFARVYPTYGRDSWFAVAASVAAFFGTGLSATPIAIYVESLAGAFYVPITLLALFCVFLAIFSPGIFLLQREKRVWANYKKEHPEYEALSRFSP